MEKLYVKIAEILDVETVSADDKLRDFEEWDSVAAISLIAYAEREYGVFLKTEDIRACETVGDFVAAVSGKMH